MDKFTELVAQKGQQIMDENNQCSLHPKQPLVAFVEDGKKFLCQSCLFEGNYERPTFMTVKARQIQDRVHGSY